MTDRTAIIESTIHQGSSLGREPIRQLAAALEDLIPGDWGVVECLPAATNRYAVATNTRPAAPDDPFGGTAFDTLVTTWVGESIATWWAATSPTRIRALLDYTNRLEHDLAALPTQHARELATRDARIRQLEDKLEARRG